MDCIVFENVSGLTNMPTAMWMGTEETTLDLSANDDITITASRNDTVAVATLTFDPLRASYGEGGEVYRCVGSLMTLAVTPDAVTPGLIEVDRQEALTVQSKLLYQSLTCSFHPNFYTQFLHQLCPSISPPLVPSLLEVQRTSL